MRMKRLVASIGATFDGFVTKMENHEAVAASMIDEVKKSAAQIKMEKQRASKRCEKLLDEKERLQKDIARWRMRAKACVGDNEYKAIECIRQASTLEKRLEKVQENYQEAQKLKDNVTNNLTDIEAKLSSLESRRAMLSSREARAHIVNSFDNGVAANTDAVFDRWERDVIGSEYEGSISSGNFSQPYDDSDNDDVDLALSREFEAEEEQSFLEAELNKLKAEVRGEEVRDEKGERHE